MKAIAVVGHKKTGKTRLIERLIPIFIERGYRVGTVKHAPHLTKIDRPDSDSVRQREAGAEQTLVMGELDCALFWERDPDISIEKTVSRLFPDFDLVLVEGFKSGPFPKIEVYRHVGDSPVDPLAGEIEVAAVVTKERVALPDGVAIFSPSSVEEIADFIETTFL